MNDEPRYPDADLDPRVARSRARILEATRDELLDRGYAGITIEGIAARAEVGKATVYRHFPTRSDLVMQAVESAKPSVPEVDTGDLRTDLVTLLESLVHHLTTASHARIFAVLVDAGERDAALAAEHQASVSQRRQPLVQALQRGIARGELSPTVDLELATDLLVGPLVYRRFFSRAALPSGITDRVVDAVLHHLVQDAALEHDPAREPDSVRLPDPAAHDT